MFGAGEDIEQDLRERMARAEKERDQLGAMCAAQDWRKEPIGERSNELAAAVDALDKWAKERAAESAGSFTCPTCGPHVKADEDGCCATCGEDCKMEGA